MDSREVEMRAEERTKMGVDGEEKSADKNLEKSAEMNSETRAVESPQEGEQWAEGVFEALCVKMRAQCERVGSRIPYFPYQGHYVDCMMPDGISWWTNGFWPGMLWQMYHATGEEVYRNDASAAGERLEEALAEFTRLHHDVGFMFLPSAVAEYKLTGSENARRRGLHAAGLLAGRYNPAGSFIKAWDSSMWPGDVNGWMIIDSLLNLPLLYWAGEVTGDPRFADIAVRHANTARNTLLRPDGSCHHVAVFDPCTGEFLGGMGGQGYGDGSSWSRGQGWAVYGMALAYRHTGKQEYLEDAKRCAHYCIASLAINDWTAPVDFRAPAEPVRYDSGAGAVIACGLLEIAEHVPKLEQQLYRSAALKILQACDRKFTDYNPDNDGILSGGATMYHNDRMGSQAFIYGDYFYLEAILRLNGRDMMIW